MTTTHEPESLDAWIRDEIHHGGPISFRRFMELALYHPRWGYYRRGVDPFGVAGDYYTSSQLQPVFGRLVAQQIERWREQMGRPRDFTVVELGPGRGETAAVARERLPEVRWITVEQGGTLPSRFVGVVFSNEFFDALPVHSVENRGGQLREHHVAVSPDGFHWSDGPLSDPAIADYLKRYAADLEQGQRIEVNLAALQQLQRIAGALERGYLVTIDYGYTRSEIAGARRFPLGSLMSYQDHRADLNVLAAPGTRDITAHVNFTALEDHGAQLGLVSEGLRSQARFLMDVGEPDQFHAALEADGDERQFSLRMQLKTLLFGMGETFQVLVQRKSGPDSV